MEKILIISYRFPPADETGTQRTWALARYLQNSGYYPIFVTRNWDIPLKSIEDRYTPVGDRTIYQVREGYKAHILPNRDILQFKINRIFKNRFTIIRKVFNLVDNLLCNLNCFKLNEYNAFLKEAKRVAKNHPEIKKAIVIADPFYLFYIGYYLNKKFGIEWIADYRDDWSTRKFIDTYNFKPTIFHRTIYLLERYSERRWVGSAKYITSISDEYTNRISKFVNVKGITIYNGFFEDDYQEIWSSSVNFSKSKEFSNKKQFNIVHSGTLYPTQKVEIFLKGVKKIIDEFKDRIDIKVKFIGIQYRQDADKRITQEMTGYEDNFICTKRMGRTELFGELKASDLALMISHGKEYKGVTSSKIFDYLGLKKEVVCCPSDGDVVEKILTETGTGYFCNSSTEVYEFLKKKLKNSLEGRESDFHVNYEKCLVYSRANQTRKVAALLDRL